MNRPVVAPPARVAVAGFGGYARHLHSVLQRLEREGLCRVAATCDPAAAQLLAQPEVAALDFPARGVRVAPDFPAMLDGHAGALDAVFLPVPIHLHAPLHRACVERGLPVYLEKPPTLWWEELEDMIATEARAPLATEVGYNFITEPGRRALKARLLAGEFGALRAAGFAGVWPRAEAYFARNHWAGKLFLPGAAVPLLDSCFGNAMGHFVHNLLYWAGADADGFAPVRRVRAALYRAHAIAGPDTVFSEATTDNGVALRVGATHAAAPPFEENTEFLECERARIRYVAQQEMEIAWRDGRVERADLRGGEDHFARNFRRFFAYLAGAHAAPVNNLAASRPFVAWNDLLYAATPGLATVAGPELDTAEVAGKGVFRAIRGVAGAIRHFAEHGAWPTAPAQPWAREPGAAHLADLPLARVRIATLASP